MGVVHLAVVLVMILVLIDTKCYGATYDHHVVETKSSSSAWCGTGSIDECLMMDDDDVEQDLEMLMMKSQVIIRMLGEGKDDHKTSGSGNRTSTLSCGDGRAYSDCKNKQPCGTYTRGECHNPPPPAPPGSLTIFN